MSEKQVISGHREIATLLGTPEPLWMSDKPCRTAEGITGSQPAVCRRGGHGVDRRMHYRASVDGPMAVGADSLTHRLLPEASLPLPGYSHGMAVTSSAR